MVVTDTGLTASDILANRYGLVSLMADDIAHEIKNPLHSMAINLEVMKRRAASGDTDSALDRAVVIDAELRRVNELVERLLRLVRPNVQERHAADVDGTLDEIAPLLAARARVAHVPFEFEPIGAPVLAAVTPTSLKFAVLNAIQEVFESAQAGGGTILLHATAQPLSVIVEASMPAGAVLATTRSDGPDLAAGVHFADAILKPAGGAARLDDAPPGTVAVRLILPAGVAA